MEIFNSALIKAEELGNKRGMAATLMNIGIAYDDKGDYDTALDYYDMTLKIYKELGNTSGMAYVINNIGIVHVNKADYEKATEYLEKSLNIQKEIGLKGLEIYSTTYLYLTYKHFWKEYDVNEIHTLIKEANNIEFEANFRLYALLYEKIYLESAYTQLQEKTDILELDVAAKYLSYPIPKAIVEEWEKVKK